MHLFTLTICKTLSLVMGRTREKNQKIFVGSGGITVLEIASLTFELLTLTVPNI